ELLGGAVLTEQVFTIPGFGKMIVDSVFNRDYAVLAEEAIERDAWAKEVSLLKLPKLVEQVALNAWKEQDGARITLHLRSAQRHLHSPGAVKTLGEALGELHGSTVELTIIEDGLSSS
ncbi:DNA polymerase III subunit gamma/tau C-terminal domain-containing protein, partial [Herbaspirillum sp. B65]|uniref:DNA polymerase III subunit gamma/tau C-terminal domain-containing protein n=1 Tax=Herbaspirillum sp. B65 TaxID=137708 RepID=UPI00273903CA